MRPTIYLSDNLIEVRDLLRNRRADEAFTLLEKYAKSNVRGAVAAYAYWQLCGSKNWAGSADAALATLNSTGHTDGYSEWVRACASLQKRLLVDSAVCMERSMREGFLPAATGMALVSIVAAERLNSEWHEVEAVTIRAIRSGHPFALLILGGLWIRGKCGPLKLACAPLALACGYLWTSLVVRNDPFGEKSQFYWFPSPPPIG